MSLATWTLIGDGAYACVELALICVAHNVTLSAERIVEIFVMCWNIEVTFEKVRRHLGVETQRQWSGLAIVRTSPMLMALFSLVCLIAMQLLQGKIMPLHQYQTGRYSKQNAAFSDVLPFVRRSIWSEKCLHNSKNDAEYCKLPRSELEALLSRCWQLLLKWTKSRIKQ